MDTSIGLSDKTKTRLKKFKNHPTESFDSEINRILNLEEENDDNLLSKQDLKDIEKSLEQIKNGEFTTHAEIKKKYKI